MRRCCDGMPPQRRRGPARGRRAARRPGAPPARVAHQFLAAGQPARAMPFVLPGGRDRRRAGRLPGRAGPGRRGPRARRAEDRAAPAGPARRPADGPGRPGGGRRRTGTPSRDHRHRAPAGPGPAGARGRASPGDLRPPRAALGGLELEGDAADGPILLARGNLAYFSGDIDAAWEIAGQARDRLLARRTTRGTSSTWSALQGLIAHQRGEWFERFRLELRRTAGQAGAGHGAVRRAPVRRGVPALRPDPLRRGDRARPRSCAAGPTGTARCAGSPSPPP